MERFLVGLLVEGNQVRVLLDDDHSRPAGATRPLDALRAEHRGLTCAELPSRTDPWRIPADAIQRRLQYLHSLEPERGAAAADQAPPARWGIRAILCVSPFRGSSGRRRLVRVLGRLDAAMPIPRAMSSSVAADRPDAVIVLAPTWLDGTARDWLRAAQAEAIPSLAMLTTDDDPGPEEGVRGLATLTVVAGQEQAEEPVGLLRAVVGGEVEAPREGRFLKPALWLLTPLLVLLLPLLRPRATAVAARRGISRLPRRIRKRSSARRKRRDRKRRAAAAELKQRKRARAEEAQVRKAAEAEEKRQRREKAQGRSTRG